MDLKCTREGEKCYGNREFSLLFDISGRLIKGGEISTILNSVLELTCRSLVGQSSFLSILNRDKKKIYIEVATGLSDSQKARGKYKIGEGVIGRVVEYKKPVIIREITKSKLFLNRTKKDFQLDGKESSFICVPVFDELKVVGTLSLTRMFDENYNYDDDVRLLSIVGSMIIQYVKTRQEESEEIARLKQTNEELRNSLGKSFKPKNIVGNSSAMQDVYNLVKMVSRTNSSVLIRGESGIGKELFADSIHYSSPRKNKPFIKVNCSALPDSLIESELFGHEKGAFTGADMLRKGRFELADGGTIFLDEIGDLPASTQVKLLRVIQERQFERLGGTKTISVDVRIVSATNRNLEEAIQNGTFREDLFYRINVFPIFIPSLRQRRNDIPSLVDHFIEKFNKENGTKIIRITTSAINMLMVYSWPGNIRELENAIERACILTTDNVVHSYNLPPTLQTADSSKTTSPGGLIAVVEKVERQLIIETLTTTKGNITQAAKDLMVTERMLGIRVKKYNIESWRYKV
ncbi:MAG: sigma 54-interacting transcriptional regulator [Prolixibacteraceae bacterium]|jgi:Nif-specific regulatory protein|nr:sigma 54-interacting transcriptional regulator [Prolixibacteraceae bacterium]